MGLRINTNVSSLRAQNNLKRANEDQSKTLERLASGNRINSAADDAAGLAISSKLTADIRSTRQATRNAGDGISMIQVAEGGLNEVSNILVRLRELSIQSASDTIGEKERQFTDLEFQSLVQEIDRISASTEFNGKKLLSGEGQMLDFQVGSGNKEGIDRFGFDTSINNAKAENLGVSGMNLLTKDSSRENLENIDNAINMVNSQRSTMGALQNRLQSTIRNLDIKTENLSAANSRIKDADIAIESAELTKNNILQQSSASVLAQANQSHKVALNLI